MIEIKKVDGNNYKFSLKSSEGQTLLDSTVFPSKKEAKRNAKQLTSLEDEAMFERRTDHSGKFLFRLKDKDGNTIGDSLLYGSEAGMENGIKNLKNSIASLGNTRPL